MRDKANLYALTGLEVSVSTLTAILVFVVLVAHAVLPANAQLILITGSPTPQHNESFHSALYRLVEAVPQWITDATPKGTATSWIGISLDKGLGVFKTGYPHNSIHVVDLPTAAVTKVCAPPAGLPARLTLTEQWLLDVPGRGLVYAQYLDTERLDAPLVRTMSLRSTDACDVSFVGGGPLDVRYLYTEGRAGVADLVPSTGLTVGVELSGRVTRRIGGSVVALEDTVPAALIMDQSRPLGHLGHVYVNNRDVMAISFTEGPEQARRRRLLVLRKRDKSWRALPLPADRVLAWVRGFGSFVTVTDAYLLPTGATSANTPARKSAGPLGPSVHYRLTSSRHNFPGTHYLFDIERGKSYTLATGQSDSEILLVDNGVVYYRTNNQLWQANILDTTLSTPRLLTKSDVITDVHWAYIKR